MGSLRVDPGPLNDGGSDEREIVAGLRAVAAVAGGNGVDGRGPGRTLVALPDAMLSEVLGNLDVNCLGRASCVCRYLRETCSDERLWILLWKGPLPGGFSSGGKAAHAALWLLARGDVEQTRVAVCEPTSPTRVTSRRRVGEAITSSSVNTVGGGRGHGGGEGPAGGGGGAAAAAAAAGFPVHVSCMAVSGGVIATAAGPEITVWGMGKRVTPRARFKVSGHGSVTCLLLRNKTLLAGDNSGYLRSYDIGVPGGRPLHEIRTHTDRVTAIDSFTHDDGNSPAADTPRETADGSSTRSTSRAKNCSAASAPESGDGSGSGGQQRRWDQGHGWGEGWQKGDNAEEADGRGSLLPQRCSNSDVPPPSHVSSAPSSGASVGVNMVSVGRGRGHGQHGHGGVRALGESRVGFSGFNTDLNRLHSGMPGNGSRVGGSGEPSSWLGKRQGYAGRGQVGKPAGAIAAIGGTRMQQSGGEMSRARRTWGGGDGNHSRVSAAGGAASPWREIEEEEENEWLVSRRRLRGGCGEQGDQRAVLFTGSDDGTAKAWDASSGRFVRLYAGHTRGITCLQATFTKSYGPALVTGGGDSSVMIWELATGRCLEKLETGAGLVANPGRPGPRVGCLQVYNELIVVGEDRYVSVWSLRRGERPRLARTSFCEHQRPIRRLDMVGPWIVTCSGDYLIRLWDSKTGLCVRELGTKSGAAIISFRLSGLRLLTASLFDAGVLMTNFSPRGGGGQGKSAACKTTRPKQDAAATASTPGRLLSS